MTGVITRRQPYESNLKTEAEIEAMHQQAKEGQGSPAGHHRLGERHGTDSLSGRTNPANTLISGFKPSEL